MDNAERGTHISQCRRSFLDMQLSEEPTSFIDNGRKSPICQLEELLDEEKHLVEQLKNNKLVLENYLQEISERELDLKNEESQLEKGITVLHRELENTKKKAETEAEVKRKTETILEEVEKKLQDQESRKRREVYNENQVKIRITELEKQVEILEEKLENEMAAKCQLSEEVERLSSIQSQDLENRGPSQNTLENLEQQKDLLRKQVAELQEEIINERKAIIETVQLHDEIEELKKKLAKEESDKKQADWECQELEDQNSELSSSVRKLQEQLLNLQDEFSDEKSTAQGLRRKLEVEQESCIRLQKELDKFHEARGRADENQNEMVENLQEEMGSLLIRISALQEEMSEDKERVASLTKELEKCQLQLEEERKGKTVTDILCKEKDKKISILMNEVQMAREELKTFKDKHNYEMRNLQMQIEEEQKKISEAEIEVGTKLTEMENLRLKEKRLMRELETANEDNKYFDEEVRRLKVELNEKYGKIKELTNDLEEERYNVRLFKTRSHDAQFELEKQIMLKEQLEDNIRELEKKVKNSVERAEMAEVTIADLEYEKNTLEKEKAELLTKQQELLTDKDRSIQTEYKKKEDEYRKTINGLLREKSMLNTKIRFSEQEGQKTTKEANDAEIEKLRKQLQEEQMLKNEAVNKLAELMSQREVIGRPNISPNKASSVAEIRRKERECLKAQQELHQERTKLLRNSKEITPTKTNRDQQDQRKSQVGGEQEQSPRRPKMEDQEAITSFQEFSMKSADPIDASNTNSSLVTSTDSHEVDDCIQPLDDADRISVRESLLEGSLGVPFKGSPKKHGWKNQYVILTSEHFVFYTSLKGKSSAKPSFALDLKKVLLVRPISQEDAGQVNAKDFNRVFEVLYSQQDAMRSKKKDSKRHSSKSRVLEAKEHEFFHATFFKSVPCDTCGKSLSNVVRATEALECKRCKMKIHKDHLLREPELIALCSASLPLNAAKELLLLASDREDRDFWVKHLSRKSQQLANKIYLSSSSLDTDEV